MSLTFVEGVHYRKRPVYSWEMMEDHGIRIPVPEGTPALPPEGVTGARGLVHLAQVEDGFALMTVKNGVHPYAWNGSNASIDTKASMLGSCGHDGGYQLIREGKLDIEVWKPIFDDFYQASIVSEGGWKWLAWWRRQALRTPFADHAAGG